MPDPTPRHAPADWTAALSALPLERPAPDAWPHLRQRLAPSRRVHPAWWALAAAIVLAVAMPWQGHAPVSPAPVSPTPVASGPDAAAGQPALEALYAESARLEALLAMARDDTVSTAAAAALAGELHAQLRDVDAALAQSGLSDAQTLALWQRRVELLRSAASFEGTRRWLAARGDRYDGALVSIN